MRTPTNGRLLSLILGTAMLLGTPIAHALVIANATSQLDWSTFTISLDSGVSITPVSQISSTSARVDVGSTIAFDIDSASAPNWSDDISATATFALGTDSATHTSDITGDLLTSTSSIMASGFQDLHTQDTAQRTLEFLVGGAGNITFTIEFVRSADASNSGQDQGLALAASILSLNNLSNSNGELLDPALPGDALTRQDLLLFADLPGGESLLDSESGTISVSAFFEDGDSGRFIAQAFSVADYTAPPAPAPAPGTALLLAAGLAGLGFARKKRAN